MASTVPAPGRFVVLAYDASGSPSTAYYVTNRYLLSLEGFHVFTASGEGEPTGEMVMNERRIVQSERTQEDRQDVITLTTSSFQLQLQLSRNLPQAHARYNAAGADLDPIVIVTGVTLVVGGDEPRSLSILDNTGMRSEYIPLTLKNATPLE
jgi:hypothetical protein